MLTSLMPDEPEVRGLLALMLLQDSRREARLADGELVLLDEQARSLWNQAQIAEGRALLDSHWFAAVRLLRPAPAGQVRKKYVGGKDPLNRNGH